METAEAGTVGQPAPGPADMLAGVLNMHLPKPLEDRLAVLRPDSGTAVADFHAKLSVIGRRERAANLSPSRGEFEGVGEQVQEDPVKLVLIHLGPEGTGRFNRERNPPFVVDRIELAGQQPKESGNIHVRILDTHLSSLELCYVEKIVNVFEKCAGIAPDDVQIVTLIAAKIVASQKSIHRTQDQCEGRPQLMTDVSAESRLQLPDRFRSLAASFEPF